VQWEHRYVFQKSEKRMRSYISPHAPSQKAREFRTFDIASRARVACACVSIRPANCWFLRYQLSTHLTLYYKYLAHSFLLIPARRQLSPDLWRSETADTLNTSCNNDVENRIRSAMCSCKQKLQPFHGQRATRVTVGCFAERTWKNNNWHTEQSKLLRNFYRT
jgi:hypothetical protein